MKIGVPKEIKTDEGRVGLTPDAVQALCSVGHEVFIENLAGDKIGYMNDAYVTVGAKIVPDIAAVYEVADMIVKVKEPQQSEFDLIKSKHTVFTYLHLAAELDVAKALVASGATCYAYETVEEKDGNLPLLRPMSEVAGRLSIQAGSYFLQTTTGGMGRLLGGIPGTPKSDVLVLGGGNAGQQAATMALGMGARVTVLDKSLNAIRKIDEIFGGRVQTLYSTRHTLERVLPSADLIIGSVLIPGAAAPKLITEQDLQLMNIGTVLVDIAIDQGGCFATSKPTSHKDPVYNKDGIIHYCVTNMPSAVARTSTQALVNATLPYVLDLAAGKTQNNLPLQMGLNVSDGKIRNDAVAEALAGQI